MFDPDKYTKSRWLKGSDLQPRKPLTLTIVDAFEHTFEERGETKPALSFQEIEQSLVMNKTQVITMIELFGGDPRLWIGQRVQLLQAPSGYQGKPTILITEAPQHAPTMNGSAVMLPVTDDDSPF